MSVGALIHRLAIGYGLTVLAVSAAAQPAPRALETFQAVCAKDLGHEATAAAFAADGWQPATAELSQFFTQDIVDPDDARRFALKTGGATILAAAMTERRGFIAKRNKTICFVRVFVETPDQMRADFRTRMGNAPDTTTDSIEVRADVWATLLGGRVVGFRAVNLPDGIWMVTISRMLADG